MNITCSQAQRILSPTQISIADFTINPYRGCPFGCRYCYAQENKSIKKRNQPWGSFIDVKINALELLKKEIKNKNIKRVLLGSTVECYPPQEKEFKLTRRIIELLNENNIAITLLTKSCLLEHDLPLIAHNKDNKIYFTINFEREDHKKLFEPASPSIKNRLTTLKQIHTHAIKSRVHIAPLIPHLQNYKMICEMVSDFCDEISIELYNFRMGNWHSVQTIIGSIVSEEILNTITTIATNKNAYQNYKMQTNAAIQEFSHTLNKRIIFLAPDFDAYYHRSVRYE